MDKEKLKCFICDKNDSVLDAMNIIDENASGIVYVVDASYRLIGSLTDGDVRRWIIDGGSLSAPVEKVMNSNPKYVFIGSESDAPRVMKAAVIKSIAVVNENNQLNNIIFASSNNDLLDSKESNALKDTTVIIMAGGKGTRLLPYTKVLPKPLIPIGDIPILERIMDKFALFGANSFYISLGYKKEIIKAYMAESELMYSIKYVEESKPLGTAGSLSLINDKFEFPVIVTNCDILINADYAEMVGQHIAMNNDLTIVAAQKKVVVPYGILHTCENGDVTSIEEKPSLYYEINTGMYIINQDLLSLIPKNTAYDMTDFIGMLIEKGKKVGKYLVPEEAFMDMGQLEQMKEMEKKISKY